MNIEPNGTNSENNGQNDTEQELTYDQVMAEMEKGPESDMNSLMASKTPKPSEDEEEPESSTPSGDEETLDPDKEDKPGADKPEGEQGAAAAAPPAKTDADRIAELERELHKTRSDAGRVPYIQRRMQELERELRATKEAARSPASVKNGEVAVPTDIEIPAALKKKYDTIRETDPDLADTLEETYRLQSQLAYQAQTTAVQTLTQEQQEREDREFYASEKAKLLNLVPQADQVFALPEWKQWKESLTPGRKAIASSAYAEEVAQAIYAFAADYQAAKGQPLFQQPTQAAPAATVAPVNSAIKAERDRKLGASAESKTATAKATEEFDDKKAYEEIYANLLKTQTRHIS